MEDYKGSHVLLFDLNDSQASSSSSSFSIGRASLCSDQEDGNKVKSHMDKPNFWKDQAKDDHPGQVGDRDHEDEAYKWMPSKMRILRKMMMSSCQDDSSQKFEDQKQFPSTTTVNHPNTSRRASYSDMINDSVRVCADCNTTKTPLWRSGPRGPKSLCNACGIRQRKARRAMAAAAAAAATGTTILPVSAPPPLKIKLKHKKKRSKQGRDDPELKKTRKPASSPKPSSPPSKKEVELVGFEDFTSRVMSKHYYAKVFPQDEKEAAILLMALSCGIVCN